MVTKISDLLSGNGKGNIDRYADRNMARVLNNLIGVSLSLPCPWFHTGLFTQIL